MACPTIVTADDSNIILSNYSVVSGTVVQVGCKKFGRRLTFGQQPVTCSSSSWAPSQIAYKCEWNGDLTTYEKLIIGTSSAGGGVLMLGILLICCLANKYSEKKKKKENDVDSYPPSAINEKVGYAQYSGGYGNGYGGGGYGGGGGGGGEIRGYRPSGKYEKQITSDTKMDSRNEPLKRDPILWSNANPSQTRDTDRSDQTSGYQFYTGKNPSSQYDNRAFERNEYDRGSGYRDTGYHGTSYMQGKREDFRWK